MSALSLSLFGRFHGSLNGEPLDHFRTNKVQALLIYLAVEQAASRRERLMNLFWPGMPERSARQNLRQTIYNLRRAIPDLPQSGASPGKPAVPLVLVNRQTLQLNPLADAGSDAGRFAALIKQVETHDHLDILLCHDCRKNLEEVVALYGGDFLADFYLDDSNEFEAWAEAWRQQFRRHALDALEILAAVAVHSASYNDARSYIERELEIDDLRESAYRQLMKVLTLNGQRAEAMAAYEGYRRLLAEELAMEPAARTSELYDQIRAGDMNFAAPPAQEVRGLELKEKIGEGTYGAVHRALQPAVGREVAVKVIRREYADDPRFIRRFESEAQIIARLEHPYIVPLYDYWRDPQGAYLVMRLLRGGTLLASLEKGPWALEPAVRMVDQITSALAVAHSQGVIHRDIKPANILLDEAGNAYLSDFGIAKDLVGDLGFTAAGGILGTPDYVSPEQLRNEPLSPPSDLFSLGAVLYETLTGERPFPDLPVALLIQKQLEEPLPPVSAGRPDLPRQIDAVIQRATAKHPGDRYPSALAMAEAFRRAARGGNGAAPVVMDGTGTIDPAMPAAVEIVNPYKGLRAFQEIDTDDFYGRDALVEQLILHLGDSRFLAVIGPSGSGKSSLVKAGLLPALRQEAIPGSDNWFVAEMMPGRDPLQELAGALLPIAVDPPPNLLDPLQRDERGLLRTLRRILPGGQEGHLLLVIDQFEELFTLVEDDAARLFFLRSLLAALNDRHMPLRVVVTLRADFYDRPLQVPPIAALFKEHNEVVLPLSRDELIWAIREPARRTGVSIEDSVLLAMVADVGGQPGALPLLQYALTELFDHRQGNMMTAAAYQALGGVSGALAGRAEEIYAGLGVEGQDACRQLFLRLVTLGEGVEDTRRRVLLSELEALPATDLPLVMEAYGAARLLTFDHDPGTREPTVEVAHEALLREWPRLRRWLDESRTDVRLQRLLSAAVSEWQAAGEDEGYLLRGGRLDQYRDWPAGSTITLTAAEARFLAESLAAREQRQAGEEARRRKELETAQQLARAEQERAAEQALAAGRLRRRALILAGALGIAALLALAAVFFANQSAGNARAAETEAEVRATAEGVAQAQRDMALQREREALQSFSLSLAANARQALEASDQSLAMLLALAANSIEDPPLEAWRTLLDVAYAPGTIREFDAGSPVNAIAASPDGKIMLSGSDDGLLRVWDIESGNLLHSLEAHQDAVAEIAFSPDGAQALSGGGDGSLLLWNTATWEVERELEGHNNWIGGLVFLPGGRALSGEDSGRVPGDLILWDLASGEIIKRFGDLEEQVEGVRGIAVSPDGQTALVGYGHDSAFDTSAAAIWDIENAQVLHFLSGPEGAGESINSVAVTPDGRLGLGASDNRNVYIWDMNSGVLQNTMSAHNGLVTAVGMGPDGLTALSGSLDGGLIQWDVDSGRSFQQFNEHQDGISAIAYLDDRRALSGSWDGTIRLWDMDSRWILERWRDPSLPADHVTYTHWMSPDGRFGLVLTGDTMNVPIPTLWDYEAGVPLRRLPAKEPVFGAAFSADNRRLITAYMDGTLALWDVETGSQLKEYAVTGWGAGEAIRDVDISSDGRYAITAGYPEVLYWDLESGEILQRMTGHFVDFPVLDVHFLPGDRQAVSAGGDGTIVFWDLATGEQIRRLSGLEGGEGGHLVAEGISTSTRSVGRVEVNANGSRLLSAGDDGTLLLWDLISGQSITRLRGHSESVATAALSADGRLALSGAIRDDMILWDVGSGRPIRRFHFPADNATPQMGIRPDGQTAISDYPDTSIIKWQLAEPQPAELIDWISANRALRELTCLERETYRIEPFCVDGQPQETTAEMLAAARQATADLDITPPPLAGGQAGEPLWTAAPRREPKTAVLGENHGELLRGDFDVWTYEGRAGEIISLHMVADNPLTDYTIPLEDRYAAGVLDTVISIALPDGSHLADADDETTDDLQRLSDARILAVRLPQDGPYRIEARSALDDQAGTYTLTIEEVPEVWHEALYEEYTGHYLEGPWQWNEYFFIHDGRFYTLYPDESDVWFEIIPFSETEFYSGGSSITRVLRDESGAVSGFEVLYGFEHPEVGGHWYEGTRVGDLPQEFLEKVKAGPPQ